MVENHNSSLVSLDKEDCLKAAGVFRRRKTLLLLIVAICLLLLQASFYLLDEGYIKVNGHEPAAADQAREPNPALQFVARWLPADFISNITFSRWAQTVNLVNTVLISAAAIYCLTLLFSLNISIHGGLGGLKHITRAFILSLVMLVLLLPWQEIFGSVATGAVFTPQEMVKWYSFKTEDVVNIDLYYLRFGGYGLLMFLLLILSGLGSLLWTRAILFRIKVAKAEIDWWSSAHQHVSSAELPGSVGTQLQAGGGKYIIDTPQSTKAGLTSSYYQT